MVVYYIDNKCTNKSTATHGVLRSKNRLCKLCML